MEKILFDLLLFVFSPFIAFMGVAVFLQLINFIFFGNDPDFLSFKKK